MRDVDIRRQLREVMRHRHRREPDTLILDELSLCQGRARVDIVVVNGSIHGYEIKSERDTLARLPGQQDVYNRALDYVTVVTAETHAQKVLTAVPMWWGVHSVRQKRDGTLTFRKIRSSRRNPAIELGAVAQFLWRDEVLAELESRGLADGVRSKPRRALWDRLVSALSAKELGYVVRARLRQRPPSWRLTPSLPA